MTVEHRAKIIRASYEPNNRPAHTEILIHLPGEVDLSYGDLVTVTVNEGEVK